MSQVYLTTQIIDSTVHDILAGATCDGHKVLLNCPQLDRDTYKQVDDVLKRLGGKWKGGRVKAHIFPFDPKPLLDTVLSSGMKPQKNPLDFYATPAAVIHEMINDADMAFCDEFRVLEPSAGLGAIADGLRDQYGTWIHLDLVEMNPLNVQVLRDKGYAPIETDFLQFQTDTRYERIIMNPPFTSPTDKKAYQQHIQHAFSLLAPGGRLVSIAPLGVSFQKDSEAFDGWVSRYGYRRELPRDAFKKSGTNTATCLIVVNNTDQSWRKQLYNGLPSWDLWCINLYESNNQEDHRNHMKLLHKITCGDLGRDLLGFALPETEQAIRQHYQWLIRKYRREYGESILLEEWEWSHLVDRVLKQVDDLCCVS